MRSAHPVRIEGTRPVAMNATGLVARMDAEPHSSTARSFTADGQLPIRSANNRRLPSWPAVTAAEPVANEKDFGIEKYRPVLRQIYRAGRIEPLFRHDLVELHGEARAAAFEDLGRAHACG